MVRIQCFGFGSRGKATERSVVGRRSGGSELVFAPWEGSATRRDGVVTSAKEKRWHRGGDVLFCSSHHVEHNTMVKTEF
jgi:hypothetical protein